MSKAKKLLSFFKTKFGRVHLRSSIGSNPDSFFSDRMTVKATIKNNLIGTMVTDLPFDQSFANIKDTNIWDKSLKKTGIASAMAKKTIESLPKRIKFVRAQEIIHPAMTKIGGKYKTKFIGYGMGKYGEETRLISREKASLMIEKARKSSKLYSGSVMSSTMVKPIDNISVPNTSGGKKLLKFVRIHGRIVPIRNKK